MARDYLGAVWNRGDCRGAAGSVLGTLGYGDVVEIGDVYTLGDGAVARIGDGTIIRDVNVLGIGDVQLGDYVVGEMVGRYIASIPCRVLMA